MKKTIVVLLIMMNIVSVNASSNDPKYKIIANSNSDKDIKTMYETKDDLIKDYKDWIKSVDDVDQALADHQKDYQASFKQGIYKIVIGKGKGKTLEGELKVNYCESTKDIKTKSLLFDWLF